MVFTVFFKEIKIGTLQIDKKGQHKYIPDFKGVEKVKHEASLIHEMLEETDWREPIPFFKNRIDNASRLGNLDEIKYQTDFFKMVRVE